MQRRKIMKNLIWSKKILMRTDIEAMEKRIVL